MLFSWLVGSSLNATGEPPSHYIIYLTRSINTQRDWRAAEPLNNIPYSFYKHSTRLASRRAAEPLNNTPYLFYNDSTRLASRRAAEPLNNISYSFYKHSTGLASRQATEPLHYIPYSFYKHSTRLASRRADEPAQITDLKKMALYSVVAHGWLRVDGCELNKNRL